MGPAGRQRARETKLHGSDLIYTQTVCNSDKLLVNSKMEGTPPGTKVFPPVGDRGFATRLRRRRSDARGGHRGTTAGRVG